MTRKSGWWNKSIIRFVPEITQIYKGSVISVQFSQLQIHTCLCSGRNNWISIFSNSGLDLDQRHLGSNPKLRLDVGHPYSKFGVNRPKQTKVIEQKLNFCFSNSDLDLDNIHLGSNPKLRLDVTYLYTKFGVNRPKQTKVLEHKLNFYF